MRFPVIAFATVLASMSPVQAQEDDCIENVVGKTVCGVDAQAVRARIRAEEAAKSGDSGPYRPSFQSSGTAYGKFGSAVFARGGYAFAGLNPGTNLPVDAPIFGLGVRKALTKRPENVIGLELEFVGSFDSEEDVLSFDPGQMLVEYDDVDVWGLAALVGMRWDYRPAAVFSPFASFGVGAAYIRASLEDEVATRQTLDDISFAYTGRAGFTTLIARQLSLEWGYRYLGVTDQGTFGSHSAEVGVNYRF